MAPYRHPLDPRRVLVALGIVLGVLFVLTLGYLAWRVITWIVIALFLALALEHGVRFFARWMPRGWSIALVFVLVVLAAAGLGFLFIPPLVAQITGFVEDIPELVERLGRGRRLELFGREIDVVERVQSFFEGAGPAGGALDRLVEPLVSAVESAAVLAIAVVSIVFLTLFMLVYGPGWVDGLLGLVPERARARWQRGARGVYDAIGGWVVGAVAIALVAGTTAAVVLILLGVPYAFTLGLLVAVLDPIPFVGATLAAAIVALVVFASEGIVKALIFVAVFVAYQQLENHVLYPLVYGRTVQLSPLAVIVAVLVGGELAGIVGAIAAIPIGGAIKVVADEVMDYRRERAHV